MQVILRSVKKVCSVCNQVIVTRILMMMVWYQINLCKMQTGEMNLIVHSNEINKMIIVVDVVYIQNTTVSVIFTIYLPIRCRSRFKIQILKHMTHSITYIYFCVCSGVSILGIHVGDPPESLGRGSYPVQLQGVWLCDAGRCLQVCWTVLFTNILFVRTIFPGID